MKHLYELCLNGGACTGRPVQLTYGSVRTIELYLKSGSALIRISTTAKIDGESALNGGNDLISDVLRKTLQFHLIRYGRNLRITKAELVCDQTVIASSSSARTAPMLYSLVEGKLRLPFSKAWTEKGVTHAIATTSRSAYDGRHNALQALLVAKSNRYEIERFIYYWMAVNGLYSYVAAQGEKPLSLKKGKKQAKWSERDMMRFLCLVNSWEYCSVPQNTPTEVRKKAERQIKWKVAAILKDLPDEEVESFCRECALEETDNTFVRQIQNVIQKTWPEFDPNPTPEAFLTIWFPYAMRCEWFHTDKALPVFCFAEDRSLKVIRIMNRILDSFLTRELPVWLSDAPEIVEKRNQRIQKVIDSGLSL